MTMLGLHLLDGELRKQDQVQAAAHLLATSELHKDVDSAESARQRIVKSAMNGLSLAEIEEVQAISQEVLEAENCCVAYKSKE